MDLKIALIIICVFLIVIFIFAIMYIIEHFKNEKLKKDYDRLDEWYDNACLEIEKLRQAENIKSKNKKEADEKVNDLLNGDLSADDILPKRKSNL